MAKSKTKKKDKNKQSEENDILVYIYALVLITLSIIGLLNIGFVGEVLTNVMKIVFGNLYGVIYAIIIVGAIALMMKKRIADLSMKYILGFSVLLMAWILLAAIPRDIKLKGMAVINTYFHNVVAIFNGELPAQGGLIGAILFALTSLLFDRSGTYIVIVAMIILGIIILINRNMWEYIKKYLGFLGKPFQWLFQSVFKRDKGESDEKDSADWNVEDEEEEPHFTPIDLNGDAQTIMSQNAEVFGKISADDKKDESEDKISFLEADEEIGAAIRKRKGIHDPKIEKIIGKEDTFVSAFHDDYANYRLPRLSLLNDTNKKLRSTANVAAANDAGKRLINILDQFGVKATLVNTHIGPSVTKFEIKPDLGVRVHKISNLQYDIKMALAAKDIRIEAPIPGKSAVGIEIPNVEKTVVTMKELMKSIPEKYLGKKLMFALGKDLMGNCIYGELNKMPHLLIAGATGSGKSVCINSIITSLIMRCTPDEVKLLLVDPKKVEFTPYHGLPHLLGPVITDGEEAARALKVVVATMDNRYELFSRAGVRNIGGYNTYLDEHPEEGLTRLPWIVVIIDELADLMLVAAKDVEASIQRITQLARAAGIHLIVATQRPSVDVITGVIKANIPSRIAFAVSSAVDSRTILDQIGAEKLLGYGDMLYIPIGEQVAMRVQGVFVSDDEVLAITNQAKAQGKPKFDDAFVRLELLDGGRGASDNSSDPLYEEVKEFVIQSRRASTSLIQRKFSIGYSRAARLIDTMEENGIIGASRGSKPREVFIKANQEEE
ncbi:MAG: DNA translocase FtsK [Erysipelotrichaceae bacterium]